VGAIKLCLGRPNATAPVLTFGVLKALKVSMERWSLSVLITALLVVSLSANAQRAEPPIEITLEMLVAHKDRLDGKLVRVRGLLAGGVLAPSVRTEAGSRSIDVVVPDRLSRDSGIQTLLAASDTQRPLWTELTGRLRVGAQGVTIELVGMSQIEVAR